ncbi:class I lanthipeptide [Chitinophaga sp. sic0106]|uniref:class I lanthipeptide n=1 Tax=Chitinophaga sp. sic0106 TaxID=2854785 RepID=UPI001C44FCBA|nr:class I lanthipeptide [Chitinophaga sp. sic0106]MBV7530264.1 class I lanthipeptide [Chitinophaga sp. sic0106]
MKKKKVDLSKKLMLGKETVAQLNAEQQYRINGGAATLLATCTEDTRLISSCRATSPGPGRPCCQIP